MGVSPPVVVRVEGRGEEPLRLLRGALTVTESTERILSEPRELARRLHEVRHATGAVAKALRRAIEEIER